MITAFPDPSAGTLYAEQFSKSVQHYKCRWGCLLWESSSQVAHCHLQTSKHDAYFEHRPSSVFWQVMSLLGLNAVSQLYPEQHSMKGRCKTCSSWRQDDTLVTSLLPHLANVVELPLLIRVRRAMAGLSGDLY